MGFMNGIKLATVSNGNSDGLNQGNSNKYMG